MAAASLLTSAFDLGYTVRVVLARRGAWMALAAIVVLTATLVLASGAQASNLYVGNYDAATISPFSIAANGSLAPIACTGSSCSTSAGGCPEQLTMTPNGKFLYVQTGGSGIVDEFQIAPNGSLSPIGSVTVAGAVGGEGILAF